MFAPATPAPSPVTAITAANTVATVLSKFGFGGSGSYAKTTGYRLSGKIGGSGVFEGNWFNLASNNGKQYQDAAGIAHIPERIQPIEQVYKSLFGEGGPEIQIDVTQPIGGVKTPTELAIEKVYAEFQRLNPFKKDAAQSVIKHDEVFPDNTILIMLGIGLLVALIFIIRR